MDSGFLREYYTDSAQLSHRIDLDELYQKKQESDISKIEIYNKVLNRIHTRIKITSRQKKNNQFCWFVVPEVILGEPRYDPKNCIPYLIEKLKDNGFLVKYTHPNLLFLTWQHYIPSYVRTEIKKREGIAVDGFGNIIKEENKKKDNENSLLFNDKKKTNEKKKNDENYKSINAYKPTGNFVYSNDMLKKMEDKIEN